MTAQVQQNELPASGKVGIGTTTPQCALDIKGATEVDDTLNVKENISLN